MPSEAFDNIVAMIRANELPDDIAEQRLGYDAMGSMIPLADGVTVETATVGGVPGEWVTPATVDEGRTILFVHGGGFVIGSNDSHRALVTHLAAAAHARVFAPAYRLAPEHPFPAAIDDVRDAYCGLLQAGVDPARLAVTGDSAGGGLVMALLLRLRDEGFALPATATPISPWVDLTQSGTSILTVGDADPIVSKLALDRWAGAYLAGGSPTAPSVSPLFADLTGLPPLLIQVGNQEVLLDDSVRLAARAEAAGVKTELVVAPDMVHVWHFFADLTPESADAIRRTAAWIIDHTASSVGNLKD